MTLLTPLGLLGLLGIAVLILIYIIKPNYQQKFVSTTFVWKLSLKYRKKRIPISKLRNLLLILCQIFILAACAVILAQPAQILKMPAQEAEAIVIIDASASMRTENDDETRFERAVNKALDFSESVLSTGGTVTVIVADDTPSVELSRITADSRADLIDTLDLLVEEDSCTYGSSDIEGAILLCEEIVADNPAAQIVLYTDTAYSYYPEQITIENVAEEEEWNVAILDGYAELEDNYYKFIVDVACYGRDEEVSISLIVNNANAMSSEEEGDYLEFFTDPIRFSNNETKQIVFINADLYQESANEEENIVYILIDDVDQRIHSYQSVQISVFVDDSFTIDNNFFIYGGQKEVVKIQYASSLPNPFFSSFFPVLTSVYSDRWEIQYTEIKKGEQGAVEGFDFYIFEHAMPEVMPTDGVVLLVDPDPDMANNKLPAAAGVVVDRNVDLRDGVYLMKEQEHPIVQYVTAENISLTKYVRASYDSDYEVLLTCNDEPVLLVKDTEEAKVVVMSFSVHFADYTVNKEFPLLLWSIFEYFCPTTVQGNSFEVNEKISFNARGEELNVYRDGEVDMLKFEAFPATFQADIPGTYVLLQETFGKVVEEKIYLKIPAAESNIFKVEDSIPSPYEEEDDSEFYNDLLVFIAAALVAVLFIEWWLQSRDNM